LDRAAVHLADARGAVADVAFQCRAVPESEGRALAVKQRLDLEDVAAKLAPYDFENDERSNTPWREPFEVAKTRLEHYGPWIEKFSGV